MESENTVVPVEESTNVANSESTPETIEAKEEDSQISDTQTNTETEGAEPSGAEKRIKQLLSKEKERERLQRQAEQEAAYWKGKAEGARTEEVVVPKPTVDIKSPKLDDFADYESYEKAKDEYLLNLAETRIQEKLTVKQQQMQIAKVDTEFFEKVKKAASEDDDVSRIMSDNSLPISKPMSDIIKRSDLPIELLKVLDEDRVLATKIANMGPLMAAKELGKLEFKIQNKPAPEPPKRVSQAPEPIQTVKSSGTPVVPENELPIEEFIRRRNKAQFNLR